MKQIIIFKDKAELKKWALAEIDRLDPDYLEGSTENPIVMRGLYSYADSRELNIKIKGIIKQPKEAKK